MIGLKRSKHGRLLGPLLVVIGVIGLCGYGTVAGMSQDPLWFQGGASVPDPKRIVLRVEGQETVLVASSPGYDLIVGATRRAMSAFDNLAPRSAGLSDATLADYQESGTVLELYFDEPVDFHLPFNDGEPTALLLPIEGRHAGQGFVFRGGHGTWWAGQLVMSDPQPLHDALSTLGYLEP